MSVVYFAGTDMGPIKIGFTANLETRIANLRTASCEPIAVLASMPGNRRTEAYLHSLVKPHQTYGEWFARNAAVLELLRKAQEHGDGFVPEEFRLTVNPTIIKPAANKGLDIVSSCQDWIEGIAQPIPFGERMETTLRRVAQLAGVNYRAVKAIWYAESHTTKAEVYIGLKEAFDARMARILGSLDRTGD